MAVKPLTLQERIKQGQALAQQTTDELAAQRGLATPPITATGVGALGGTSQQQAMAGTPAQKKGALAEAVTKVAAPQAETGLELAQKTKPEAAVDQAKQQRMQRYSQAMGTFGDKVNELIEGALQKVTGTETTPGLSATLLLTPEKQKLVDDKLAAFKSANNTAAATELESALATLKSQGLSDETVKNAIFNLNKHLGNATTEALLAGSAYALMFQDIKEGVATQFESAVQKEITGADSKLTLQDIESLGTSWDEMASLLGVTPAEVQNMSIGDLQNQLAQVGQKEFGETATVAAGMISPLASAAEREALRGVMKELEEAGIAGVELQYQQLLDDIEAGKTVKIAGQDYTIEQLLEQGTLYNLAMSVYNKTDPKEIERLKREEPELYNWLMKNRNTLVTVLETGTQGAQALKQHNIDQDVSKSKFKGSPVEKFLPTNYQIGTVLPVDTKLSWDPKEVGQAVADIMKISDPAQQTAAINGLNTITTAAKAAGYTDDEVFGGKDKDGNWTPGGWAGVTGKDLTNPDFVANTVNALAAYAVTQAVRNNAQGLLDTLTTDNVSLEEINKELVSDDARAAMGLSVSGWSQYDTNNNNVLDLEEIQVMADANIPKPTVESIRANTAGQRDSLKVEAGGLPDSDMQPVYDALTNDGKLEPEELSGLSLDAMAAIFNGMGRPEDNDSSSIKLAIRKSYLSALDRNKAEGYSGVGLDASGMMPGVSQQIAAVDFTKQRVDTISAAYQAVSGLQKSIQQMRISLERVSNPDLRWRIEQDIQAAENEINRLKQGSQAVADAIKGSGSAPTNIGTLFDKGLAQGITDLAGEVTKAIIPVAEQAQPVLNQAGKAVSGIVEGVTSGGESIKSGGQKLGKLIRR